MKNNILKSITLSLLSMSAATAMEYESTALTTGLALEGRGMKALIPAVVLRELESDTNLPVYEMFDMAAGTSSGALIMAKCFSPKPLGMSQFVDDFKQHGPELFTPKKTNWWYDLGVAYVTSFGIGGTLGATGSAAKSCWDYRSKDKKEERRQVAYDRIYRNVSERIKAEAPDIESIKKDVDVRMRYLSKGSIISEKIKEQEVRERLAENMLSLQEKADATIKQEQSQYDQTSQYGVKDVMKDVGKSVMWSLAIHTLEFTLRRGCPKIPVWLGYREAPIVAQYDTEKLDPFLMNMLRDVNLRDTLKQIFIPVTKKDGTVFLFNSLKALRSNKYNYSLVDAVQSTMSHPQDFDKVEISNVKNSRANVFYDNGVVKDNPTNTVFKRLKKVQPRKSNLFILSLGIADIVDKPTVPLSLGGMYTFPDNISENCLPGLDSTTHYNLLKKLGGNYIRKQAEFVCPHTGLEITNEILEEYEAKGMALAKELQEANIFRKLAENRSNKRSTQLEDEERAAFEELTGIHFRRSPDHENEEEINDQSWREKEPETELKKDI